jgi:hypothetical protein
VAVWLEGQSAVYRAGGARLGRVHHVHLWRPDC